MEEEFVLKDKFNILVESNIISISTDYMSNIINIKIFSPWNKNKYLLTFEGVDEVNVWGLRMNNIIDEMKCYSKNVDKNVISLLKDLFIEETSSCNGRLLESYLEPILQKKARHICDGKFKIWHITAVCGASLIVLGERIFLRLID